MHRCDSMAYVLPAHGVCPTVLQCTTMESMDSFGMMMPISMNMAKFAIRLKAPEGLKESAKTTLAFCLSWLTDLESAVPVKLKNQRILLRKAHTHPLTHTHPCTLHAHNASIHPCSLRPVHNTPTSPSARMHARVQMLVSYLRAMCSYHSRS